MRPISLLNAQPHTPIYVSLVFDAHEYCTMKCHFYMVLLGGLVAQFRPLHSLVHRYRARLAYNGSGFQGFQVQPGRRTVQEEVEKVLSQRLNEPIRVVGAGRTDAGVHARGRAVHFDCTRPLSTNELASVQTSVEKMLPKDVALWNLQPVPPPITKTIKGNVMEKDWNVMFDSTHKLYSYRLNVSPTMDPLDRHYRWHPDRVQHWFDEQTFGRLLECYVGDHNFRAFASDIEKLERKLGGTVDTTRTVYSVKLVKESGQGNLRADFLLKGALYKQVRNLVGTALDVCQGRIDEDFFQQLIHNAGEFAREDNPAKPAPPQGLTLERVYFDEDDSSF